jgi:hypothetical protein
VSQVTGDGVDAGDGERYGDGDDFGEWTSELIIALISIRVLSIMKKSHSFRDTKWCPVNANT